MIAFPQGFLLSGINCGIRNKKLDLGLIYCQSLAKATGFFTTNANPSYSVTLSRKNINKPIKAILVNSGNANCFSHKKGLRDTLEITTALAGLLKVKKENILIASTGIIGKKLPKKKIINGLPYLIRNLGINTKEFSSSIMTTDTFEKMAYDRLSLGGRQINILGFAKGAGMIYPNMATMLAFVFTDASMDSKIFKKITKETVEKSFNSISVDGCMSTNDTVFFLSSGKVSLTNKRGIDLFSEKIYKVCLDLAKMIIKDAEGASKFIEITIEGAKTGEEAKKAALFIANSNLFKSAIYGADPNWGRIVAALGQAGIKVNENISISSTSLEKKEIKIIVDLKRGKFSWKAYTSDLTPEYIKINAAYS